jgi:hypothetical protein
MNDEENIPLDDDGLDEMVLESAAREDDELLAPETSPATAEITAWDEAPGDVGQRIPNHPSENELNIAEQLVDAGNDEADREQRAASDSEQTAEE